MTETYLEQLKPERFPSPGFVVDEAKLRSNVAILDEVQRRTGAKILMALKCFAMWDVFPIISRSGEGALYGCCASSPDEARLARECFGGEVHAFAAGYSEADMVELLETVDHVLFNSFAQWERFKGMVEHIASIMGISKYTLYSYRKACRQGPANGPQDPELPS